MRENIKWSPGELPPGLRIIIIGHVHRVCADSAVKQEHSQGPGAGPDLVLPLLTRSIVALFNQNNLLRFDGIVSVSDTNHVYAVGKAFDIYRPGRAAAINFQTIQIGQRNRFHFAMVGL